MFASQAIPSLPLSEDKTASVHKLLHRPEIDGLRAVAVLSVLAFHAAPDLVPGGFAGVDVFFVISGFLISGIILRALTTNTFSFSDFYIRRAKRIFPALIIVLFATWSFGWLVLFSDEYQLLGKHIAEGAGFVVNLMFAHDGLEYFGATKPLVHLWSLGVEEQFYLFWPLFLVAIWKLSKRRFTLIAAVSIVSFFLNVATMQSSPLASYYLPWNRLWELSVGGALAYIQLGQPVALNRVSNWLSKKSLSWLLLPHPDVRAWLGILLMTISFLCFGSVDFPGWWALVPCASTLLVISAGSHSWFNRHVLSCSPMIFIGLISYPLYLWHWPLLTFARIFEWQQPTMVVVTGAALMAFGLALVTYKYIETPLRSSLNHVRVASTLCLVMGICGGIGYLTFADRISARSESFSLDRFVNAATETFPPRTTVWGPDDEYQKLGNGSRSVLFIGDSHMFHYYARIEKLLADHPMNSRSAVFAAYGGCALAIDELELDPRRGLRQWKASCSRYMNSVEKYAIGKDVDTIVISAFWRIYFMKGGSLRPGADRAITKLKRLIDTFRRHGKRIYIVLDNPYSHDLSPRNMVRRTLIPAKFRIEIPIASRAEIEKGAVPIVSELVKLAELSGAIVIDPMESLCDAESCPAVTPNGEPIYWDSNHLRPSYVREHVTYLDETVLDAVNGAVLHPTGPTQVLVSEPFIDAVNDRPM